MLKISGINVDEGLERFMGNESMFTRFLKKFPSDKNFGELKAAVAADDVDRAIRASHTLKGVCGNLSMTVLFGLLSDQIALMRGGKWDEAKALMPDIEEGYDAVVGEIAKI